MKQMKHYQEQAVKQLVMASKMYFETEANETIVFQSPTGSGKTFMISNYISQIINDTDLNLCFLWVSIGNGNLHIQSYKSVKDTVTPAVDCTLLENEYVGYKNEIGKNEVVFLNWEKIRNKDSKTDDFSNIAMRDNDSISFIEVLENTRNSGKKIILIIDESHKSSNTSRAKELRDEIIKPFLTIEMSATPVLTDDMQMKISVDPTKVIEEGMIKKEIIINKDLDNFKLQEDEIYSENLILETAFLKREELKSIYNLNNSAVNPLVLIQLPNSDMGELKKEITLNYLKEKGLTIENGKVAVWLSEDKVNLESDLLTKNDSEVEFLLFKQAVDTGWDCPRAQILVKFRETNSIIFEIQTVGRILRMPEAHHYESEELNIAYVYTNIKNIEIAREYYNPNIIKSLCSRRKNIYKNLNLKSYYKNRIDFGDITSEYKMFFERAFCSYFNIKFEDVDIPNYNINWEHMREKGIKTDYDSMDILLSNIEVDAKVIDKGFKIDDGNVVKLKMSPEEVDIKYDLLISKNLGGFAPQRSKSKVKTAILYVFRKYLDVKPANDGITSIQNIIIRNEEIFTNILTSAVNDYKDFHKNAVELKQSGRYSEWEIPISKNYNPCTNISIDSALSLYEPLYMPKNKNGNIDELEERFIKYLEKHPDKIEWFWKNGDEHMETNFGIKKEDGYTFQPDFLIKFKNGSLGIFDTKAIGHNENDHIIKSNALYKYISEERYNGKNIFGGLIVEPSKNNFVYFEKALYKSYIENKDEWTKFDDLF